MSSSIRATRDVIDNRFKVMGLAIRTPRKPAWFEVALATDPHLFSPAHKGDRNPRNFFVTTDAIPAAEGEAIYLVPPYALAQFAGQDRVYYTMATFDDPQRHNPEVLDFPPEAAPSVTLSKDFSPITRGLLRLNNPRE